MDNYYGYGNWCSPDCLIGDYHAGPCLNEDDVEMDDWFASVLQEELEHPVEEWYPPEVVY